jgi:serine/threonine protein phosphatase PrpC
MRRNVHASTSKLCATRLLERLSPAAAPLIHCPQKELPRKYSVELLCCFRFDSAVVGSPRIADPDYDEVNFELAPGESLTFLSDGVVEARNSSGDLFGFDRAREISALPAEQIARAAVEFGQQDDITVLTFSLAPKRAMA